jgi:2',3'-cyclic-nucleotide 2'-phosphodiesterase
MNLLFIGDVVGAPGRRALASHLPGLRDSWRLDLIVANCENVADGLGVTADTARELFGLGIDVLTNGNHAWDKKEALDYIAREPRLLRPHNYPSGTPGSGWYVAHVGGQRVGILNVLGTVFMQPTLACPFRAVDDVLVAKPDDVKIVLVDMHAEATSEKTAFGWYLAGRVSAVVGSHTHIPTADERVLPGGTAYITDVGMTGCYDSVIGLGIDNAVKRLMHKVPAPWDVADGKGTLCGVVVDVDEHTGESRSIRRIALAER